MIFDQRGVIRSLQVAVRETLRLANPFYPGTPQQDAPFEPEIQARSSVRIASGVPVGDEAGMPVITANFSSDKTFTLRIEAPPGNLVCVNPPAGSVGTLMSVQLYSHMEVPLPHGIWSQPTYMFEDLKGQEPALAGGLGVGYAAYCTLNDGNFGIYMYFALSGPFSFTAFEASFTVPNEYIAVFNNTPPATASSVHFISDFPWDAPDPGAWVAVRPVPVSFWTIPSKSWSFIDPIVVAADTAGNIYVADNGTHRIQKFTSDGSFITKWGALGLGMGRFYLPVGITIDGN